MHENPYQAEAPLPELASDRNVARPRSRRFPFGMLTLVLMIAGFLSLLGVPPPIGRAMTPTESWRASFCTVFALSAFGAAALTFLIRGVLRILGLALYVGPKDRASPPT